jgi:hypothetical protein
MVRRDSPAGNNLPPDLDRLAPLMIRAMLRRGAVCLLCGGPPAIAGCFLPRRPGKWQQLWYALCDRCHRREGAPAAVEAALARAEAVGPGALTR